nr:MAG TPA: hypothetical protein [Ackermannviridae sp.]DAS65318.1 MAG TPA: hypothetical protein [Ackermannviridae sp.]
MRCVKRQRLKSHLTFLFFTLLFNKGILTVSIYFNKN